jgi:hypothetical protein
MGFYSRLNTPYIDLKSFEAAGKLYLLHLIFVSLIVGTVFYLGFRYAFPKGYEKQTLIGRTAIFIVFSCVSFAINRGWLFNMNNIFSRRLHSSDYVVKDKFFEISKSMRNIKGTKHYRLILEDNRTGLGQTFIVGKEKYQSVNVGHILTIEIYKGYFDIIYGR